MTSDEIWDLISKIKRDPCIPKYEQKTFVTTNNPYTSDDWDKLEKEFIDYLRRNGNMSALSIEAIKKDIRAALSQYGYIKDIHIEHCTPPKTSIEFTYTYKDTWNITKNISEALSAITYVEDAVLTFDAHQINAINIKFNINMSIFNKERKNNMPPRTDYSGYFATADNMHKPPESIADMMAKFFTGPSIRIKQVMFNGPATIVYWSDNTKTIVKCMEDEEFDPEKGLAMAICKRLYGGDFHRVFKDSLKNAETRKGNETKLARAARVAKAKKKKAKAKKKKMPYDYT